MFKNKQIIKYLNQLKNEFNGRYNGSGVELNIYKEFHLDTIYVDYLIEGRVICRTTILIDGGNYYTRYIGVSAAYYSISRGDFDDVLDDRLLTDIVNTYGNVVGYKEGCKRLGSVLDDLGISIGKDMGNTGICWAVVPKSDGVGIYVSINHIHLTIHKNWDDLESGNLMECLITIKGLMDNLITYKEQHKQLSDELWRQRRDIRDNLFGISI